ncbi:MAG: type-F conjugative transfer system protein TrbI [Enterobacter sichuanensis]|uniref:type-F conjugative transfer system protein TrbI n=1 Tax=Enterobacteriaceae TaxID=543 RepID=UPI000464302B|nr:MULTISPECIES: type-F conjugative transfer system protein TrbI [Enterobacter cloacae complex]QBB08629.1 type-F conjugative transfer system protein TrbI [Enterobacter cloacae]HCL5492621.1 type-F conjugative transfer system protein TrbI [Citrobacter freundii]HCM6637632.1 type-F conjugative transfer system protein TrbI [Klebsiella pneumoniae]MBG0586960.1 type-F conjugative transfer system protein TrbI [Enterobacter ludwigii]MDU5196206.1 type-F conjugative transfer system protein TrbI [Enterobac
MDKSKITALFSRRVLITGGLVIAILMANVIITRVMMAHSVPRVVAFDMKKTLDSFMDSVSRKQLTESQSKALSDRFNDALEKSLDDWQRRNHVLILVAPAVVNGAPDITLSIQRDIARRMQGDAK